LSTIFEKNLKNFCGIWKKARTAWLS
jgi:hypothetical protein